jgi:murein DD-endopeptidase MepM/ murein hydrolase activator NlpD
MMPCRASVKSAAVFAVVAMLAGCMRDGPPAPLVVMGEQAKTAPSVARTAPNAPTKAAPREAVTATPTKIETPPPATTAKGGPQAHAPHPDRIQVGKGETLYMIARRYDLPLRSIIDANHLDPPFNLAAGTSLTLPQERFHMVQSGDTLYSVARLYGVDVSTLASLNHLAAPFAIRAGQTLDLPAPVAPPERVAETPPANSAPVAPEPPAPTPVQPPSERKPVPDQAQSVMAAPASRPSLGRIFAWPLEGRLLGSYGTAPNGMHNDGINIAARLGEPVRAADAGKVAYAGNELRGYGDLVLIKHAGGYMTAYAHNSKLLVKRGDLVKRGQAIAEAGATGTVNAPQLHFEIRQGTHALDPINYLPSLRASTD